MTTPNKHRQTVKTAKSTKAPRGKPFVANDPRINKNGRPQGGVSVVDALKRELEKVADLPNNKEKRTYLELLIRRIMANAIGKGDTQMIKDIINRVDGMPVQTLANPDGTNLDFPVVYLPKEENDNLETE